MIHRRGDVVSGGNSGSWAGRHGQAGSLSYVGGRGNSVAFARGPGQAGSLSYIRVICSLTLALGLVFGALPIQGQTDAPKAPPIQWPRSHNYHVEHYKIELGIDLPGKSITGQTTITLSPFKSGFSEVDLDAGDMSISGVKLATGAPLKFRYENQEKLYVELDHPYPAGRSLAIVIAYSAKPKKGLTFIAPEPVDPNRPYQVWSQGEAETNHYWFPCYDYPNDKATSETVITADDKFMVISNGELAGVTADAARKTRTWHWKMDQPFSSYLASIIVGQFAEVKDYYKKVPVISYVYPDQVQNARDSLGRLPQMVAFFSEKIGVDYPYAKYAEITVRDFPGGMENITATTLGDGVVHDKTAEMDVRSDGLISHELAHQWFGDLLTCRDWGEIWLNESFAEFFADLWEEHSKGKDEYLRAMMENQHQYHMAWLGLPRRPVVTQRYDDPDALFDTYAYPRGAATVNMLRFVLGDEMFWRAIHHYVQKYQWKNVDTQALIDAIEESTGQNLAWFFDEWVYKMGHPEFQITSNYDEGSGSLKLSIKQVQKPSDKTPWFQQPAFFTTPVDVGITTASGEKIHRIMIDQPEQQFDFKVDSKPLIVNFDRGSNIIKTVQFKRSDEELAYQLVHDSDVTGRLRAIQEVSAHRGETVFKALAQAAQSDGFWAVRQQSIRGLADFKSPESEQALLATLKDKDSRVRQAAVEGLGRYKDAKLVETFLNLIKTDPSYFVVSESARALGQTGDARAYQILMETVGRESWAETIRGGALRGLAALKDPRALETALRYGGPGNSPSLRGAAFAVLAESGKRSDQALHILIAALKESSDQIVFSAVQALGGLGDQRAIPALEELSKRSDLPGFPKAYIVGAISLIKKGGEVNK
jgi:aminopeptidase N